MGPGDVKELLIKGSDAGCKEVLFTFGEGPEMYENIRDCLLEWGYDNVIDYLYDLCLESIDLGLFPHSNPGVITYPQMKRLQRVNASMGLMLESSSERLCEKGGPHEHSPGKKPRDRLKVIENAGRLRIPFTTGVLIGIGECDDDVMDSLDAIARLHQRYGHIQEIIIQNFKPKADTPMSACEPPSPDRMIKAFEYARDILPGVGLQAPPNLNPDRMGLFLRHGANDFGGVSPITLDYVNPHDPWPMIDELEKAAVEEGFVLRERLPVYPAYIEWLPERLKKMARDYVGEDGFIK